jgi:transcriptional regulator with XRE-family HTH domain
MPFYPATLKRVREQRELTQEALAKRARVHRVSVARWETGARTPTVIELEKVAAALKVKVTDLLK